MKTAVNLNEWAKLTSLRLTEAVDEGDRFYWYLNFGFVLITALAATAAAFILGPLGPLVVILVFLALALLSHSLRKAVDLILSAARLLESPAAIPSGIFEAFGTFVPASMTIDDLKATGVLNTPATPWSLLPIRVPRPPGTIDPGDDDGGGDPNVG